jgi:hypothetical protein
MIGASLPNWKMPVTPESLPVEEILVRGSHEPKQVQSTVLLRITGECADVPAEELLRAVEQDTV